MVTRGEKYQRCRRICATARIGSSENVCRPSDISAVVQEYSQCEGCSTAAPCIAALVSSSESGLGLLGLASRVQQEFENGSGIGAAARVSSPQRSSGFRRASSKLQESPQMKLRDRIHAVVDVRPLAAIPATELGGSRQSWANPIADHHAKATPACRTTFE